LRPAAMLNLLPLVRERDLELGSVGPPSEAQAQASVSVAIIQTQPEHGAPAPGRGQSAQQESLRAGSDEVNGGISEIRASLRRLRDSHAADLQATRPDAIHALRDAMRAEIRATASTAAKLKRRLDEMETVRRRVEAEAPGSATAREHSVVVLALHKKLAHVLQEFSALRSTFERDHLAVVSRRYAAVAGHPPEEEELRRLAGDAPREAAQGIFARALAAQGTQGDQLLAKAALAEVEERHDAIVELERALGQLHQLFLDLASLVEAQGETLDNIEASVARSVQFVEKGRQHVTHARTLQRGVRAKVLLVAAGVAAIVLIVACAVAIPAAVRG